MKELIALLTVFLTAFVAVWRYFAGKERKLNKKKEEIKTEGNKGVDQKDASIVTAAFDKFKRLRK